jgi:hypothetical protein
MAQHLMNPAVHPPRLSALPCCQASSYWHMGEDVRVAFAPDFDIEGH